MTEEIIPDAPETLGNTEILSGDSPEVVNAANGSPTGQSHHILSNKIVSALNEHPTLKGVFNREDSRFIYKAQDNPSHKGYQTWHRQYDQMVVKWIQSHPQATPQMFVEYLNSLHQQPWLQQRIPNVNISK